MSGGVYPGGSQSSQYKSQPIVRPSTDQRMINNTFDNDEDENEEDF
jgi:hypothetical protein